MISSFHLKRKCTLHFLIMIVLFVRALPRSWSITDSETIKQRDCKDKNGLPICCSALNTTETFHHKAQHITNQNCKINRIYVPSEYEILHQSKALEFVNSTKFKDIAAFLTSPEEIDSSLIWLKRVKIRMQNSSDIEATDEDYKYLSRFEVTSTCHNEHSASWIEWIEPLNFQSRHPFSYFHFGNRFPENPYEDKRVGVTNADYILIDSGPSLYKKGKLSSRSYLIDAGCSEGFQISTQYFACAYAQRGIHFDQIYSYEHVVHNPQHWWKTVPSKFVSRLHFHNVGISADSDSDNNPLNLIRDIAHPHDFVAFKLDVDTSSIEIPIAINLSLDPELLELVDEFFFELHYKCPIMSRPWGTGMKVPAGYEDKLQLDRVGALKFFSDLRHKGVRAHFWV